MARFFALAVVALISLQGSIAKPADKSQLEVLAVNAKNIADNVTHTLGLQDLTSEKVLKTLNDQTKVLADNLNTIKAKVDKEVKAHEGDVKKTLKDFEDRITKYAEDVRKVVDPEGKATKKAEEVRAQFDSTFKSAAEEIEKLVKNLQPGAQEAGENMQKFTKNILDSFLEVGKDIQKKVNKAVEDHQKTHK